MRRLKPNGQLDATFPSTTLLNRLQTRIDAPVDFALDPDQRLIVAGEAGSQNSDSIAPHSRIEIFRITSAGEIDRHFGSRHRVGSVRRTDLHWHLARWAHCRLWFAESFPRLRRQRRSRTCPGSPAIQRTDRFYLQHRRDRAGRRHHRHRRPAPHYQQHHSAQNSSFPRSDGRFLYIRRIERFATTFDSMDQVTGESVSSQPLADLFNADGSEEPTFEFDRTDVLTAFVPLGTGKSGWLMDGAVQAEDGSVTIVYLRDETPSTNDPNERPVYNTYTVELATDGTATRTPLVQNVESPRLFSLRDRATDDVYLATSAHVLAHHSLRRYAGSNVSNRPDAFERGCRHRNRRVHGRWAACGCVQHFRSGHD